MAYRAGYQDLVITSSDGWSSGSSHSSTLDKSDDDDNDSYIPEWEEFVNDDGNLFYLEYHLNNDLVKLQASKAKDGFLSARNEFKRNSMRRSKKATGKLSKLISRRTHKKDKTMSTANSGAGAGSVPSTMNKFTAKVKFGELNKGEIKDVSIYIDPSARHTFGRRTSLCEALCGISICTFPDSQNIMVAGFMPNSTIGQEKSIKVGDWLKAINGQDVHYDNINFVLMNFVAPTKILLTLQRTANEEQFQDQSLSYRVSSLTEFAMMSRELFAVPDTVFADHKWTVLNVLYLSLNKTDDHDGEGRDVLFAYPPKEKNDLYGIRGTFLTLNSLFRESTFQSALNSCSVMIRDSEYHVASACFSDEILVIGIHSKYATLSETKLKLGEMVRYMELVAKTVPSYFTYSDASSNGASLSAMCSIATHLQYSNDFRGEASFESTLPESNVVVLPKEAQLRIEDALGEMEAMDYREWNDEPLKSHREFFILGSALFFRKFLLVSHLPTIDLQDVEAFIRTTGISQLLESQPIRELIVWHEIQPRSVERDAIGGNISTGYPRRRWHLAIIAYNQIMLAVILESRHLNPPKMVPHQRLQPVYPSPFYIEEIQDTLAHLQSSGLEALLNTWIICNKRPQVSIEYCAQGMRNFIGNGTLLNGLGAKKTEIISILKHRNNSTENVSDKQYTTSAVGSSSLNSNTFSDESGQYEDNDSDSDWDGFPDSQKSSSGFDMSNMTGTLLKEMSDVLPIKITSGRENVLLHYVQIDIGDGTLIAAPNTLPPSIAVSLRSACMLIHNILQNTMRFRHLLSQEDSAKYITNRTLVAIKEHGILITAKAMDESFDFWIVGRLFSSPPKEMYVCHRSDIPQNLVELAFRFTLNQAG